MRELLFIIIFGYGMLALFLLVLLINYLREAWLDRELRKLWKDD